MPPTGKLEFLNGTPWLYKIVAGIVACVFGANVLVWYLIPKYWSAGIPDKAHPTALGFNGTIYYVSPMSHWLFAGSFVSALVAVVGLVGLGFYYRATGLAVPPVRGEDTTQLKLNR